MLRLQLLLLPPSEQPQPTHTLRGGQYVPLEKASTRVGMRGQIPGALYMPSPDGNPPPGFQHCWDDPATMVRALMVHEHGSRCVCSRLFAPCLQKAKGQEAIRHYRNETVLGDGNKTVLTADYPEKTETVKEKILKPVRQTGKIAVEVRSVAGACAHAS